MQWLALLAVVCALACSGKSSREQPAPPPPPADAAAPSAAQRAACDQHAEHVRGLYRAQLEDAIDGEVDDATGMILADCYRDAERFAPCIATAKTIAELERSCVVPLDDQGLSEQALFGGRPRP